MPWAFPLPQKQLILTLARGKYQGFNDSHLTEKLHTVEHLEVSRETVRRILRAARLPSPQKRRPRQYRARRLPRPRMGMMALTDASRHDWLEGRGPQLTLIGLQDDATSQILAAHFSTRSREHRRLSPRSARHDHHAWRPAPASIAIVTASSSATMPIGPWPNNSLENKLPRSWDALWRNSVFSRFPPTRRKPRAASNALGALARTVWSANSASLKPPLCRKPTPCSIASAPTQPALRPSRRRRHPRLPPPAPPLRSRPLSQFVLSTRRRRRPHRHLRYPLHRPAALVWPSRLRRTNGGTFPSARWHAARLSRRSSAVGPALVAARIFRSSPGAPHHRAETNESPMPRIYNLSGRPALAAVT